MSNVVKYFVLFVFFVAVAGIVGYFVGKGSVAPRINVDASMELTPEQENRIKEAVVAEVNKMIKHEIIPKLNRIFGRFSESKPNIVINLDTLSEVDKKVLAYLEDSIYTLYKIEYDGRSLSWSGKKGLVFVPKKSQKIKLGNSFKIYGTSDGIDIYSKRRFLPYVFIEGGTTMGLTNFQFNDVYVGCGIRLWYLNVGPYLVLDKEDSLRGVWRAFFRREF